MSSKFKILNEIFIDTNICTLYAYIFYYLIVQLFIKSIPCKWERLSSNMYCPGIFQTQILTNANGKMLFPRISRSAASFQHCFFLVGWVEWIVCVIWTACKMCGKANETRSYWWEISTCNCRGVGQRDMRTPNWSTNFLTWNANKVEQYSRWHTHISSQVWSVYDNNSLAKTHRNQTEKEHTTETAAKSTQNKNKITVRQQKKTSFLAIAHWIAIVSDWRIIRFAKRVCARLSFKGAEIGPRPNRWAWQWPALSRSAGNPV